MKRASSWAIVLGVVRDVYSEIENGGSGGRPDCGPRISRCGGTVVASSAITARSVSTVAFITSTPPIWDIAHQEISAAARAVTIAGRKMQVSAPSEIGRGRLR